MVQIAERAPVRLAPVRSGNGWLRDYGYLVLAVIGAAAFIVIAPPVADLQAADARAGAAGRHVGLGYWLSWFGGSTPGQYSVLTPAVAALVGVTTLAAASVLVIAVLCGPLLANVTRPTAARYLVVACALCDLFSGRVPFSVGLAVSLVGVLLLLRDRPVAGGVVNGVATLFSPLAPAFVLLAMIGPAIALPQWRRRLVAFGVPSVVGLVLPAVFFGAPSAMPFPWTTLAWSLCIVVAMLPLDLPRHLKLGLWATTIVSIGAFFVPSGVGSNISRYAFLVLPPLVCAFARNRRRVVVLALLPALVYSGYVVGRDVTAASRPAAQQTYYTALRSELLTLPDRDNHRFEVLDTATHRAAAELIPDLYLARGWETQNDATNNALFYDPTLLSATSYRNWLDENAVAWVAVPDAPGPAYQSEAALIGLGLNYLSPIWSDTQWTVYAVHKPEPIVPQPAHVVAANESEVVFDIDRPAVLTMRLRPARFIQIVSSDPLAQPVCVVATTAGQLEAHIPAAGRYVLTSGFSVTSTVKSGGGC